MNKCPNKSSGEYKKLFKYYENENAVYSMYISNEDDIPTFPNLTDIKKDMGFVTAYYTERKTSNMMNRLAKYNEVHNTRHRIEKTVDKDDVITHKLHLNFTPKYARLDGVEKIVEDNEVDGVIYEHSEVDTTVEDLGDGTYNVDGEVIPASNYTARYAFQLSNKAKKTSTSALDEFLVNYLSKFGITVEQITNFKEQFGVDGIAVSDMLKKMISVAEGKADITTLPEEASHFIIEMLGENHPLFKSMANNVKTTKEYAAVVEEYGELYDNNETKLIKEAMGKILATYIVGKYNDKGISVLDRIINWFKNSLKSFSKTDLQKGIDDIYSKIAEGIFKDTLDISSDNIKSTDKYFQVSNNLENLKKKLSENITRLNNRAIEVARKTASNESNAVSENLKMAAKILKGNLDKDQTKLAITNFVSFIKANELEPMMKTKKYYDEHDTEEMSSKDTKELIDITTVYTTVIDDLMIALDHPEFKDVKEAITKDVNEVLLALAFLKMDAKKMHEKRIRRVLEEVSVVYTGPDGKQMQFNPDELLNSKVGDIGWVGANVMPMHSVNDEVLKMVWSVVNNIHNEAHRKAYDNGRVLHYLQSKMEDASFKDMSIFKEKDEHGNFTGFMISDKNWGIYNRELTAVKERIRKALGVESYYDVVYEQLDKDGQKVFKNEWGKFAVKYKTHDGAEYQPNPPVNKEFAKLLAMHPTVAAYYKELEKIHIESRENLPRIYNSLEKFYMLPQIRKDDMQILVDGNDTLSVKMRNLGARFKDKFKIVSDDTEYGDQSGDTVINVHGAAERMLPIYFTKPLADMTQLSNNITGMYAHFSEMAYNFNGLAKRLDDLSLIQSQLGSRSVYKTKDDFKRKKAVLGATTNEYKAMENFLKIHVFGESVDKANITIDGKTYDTSKFIRKIIGYIRAKNLFMNVFTALSGGIKGNIDSTIDAAAGTYITKESQLWATAELAKSFGSFMKGMVTKNNVDKTVMILERSGALKNMHSIFDRLDINNPLGRVTTEDVIYGMYEPFSTQIKGAYGLAIYDNNRLINGKFVDKATFQANNKDKSSSEVDKLWSSYRNKSLYNAYEAKDGRLVIKEEFKKYVTPEVENRIEGLIKSRVSVIEGTLGTMDKGAAHTGIAGQLILLHRGWLIQGATERWKKGGVNYSTGQYEEGFHRTCTSQLIKFLKYQATKEGFLKAYKPGLEPYQLRNIKRGSTDVAFSLALFSLYLLAQSAADDDKEGYWAQFIAYLSTRALLEQNAFTNPVEVINIISSPSAATSTLETLYGISKAPFKKDIKSGVYKGKTYFEKSLMQLSPFKNMYELQDPKSKNKFVKSQII